jgi:glycosyltransferase involved in cell wall biosynthesis
MTQRKSKLKILYTIPNFDTAGSGKVLYDLAKGLNPDYFEVAIACNHNKGDFFKNIEALGFPIYFVGHTFPLKPYYKLYTRLNPFKKFVKENRFDIVHSWNWSSDWTEVIAARLGGAKYIYTKKAMSWGNLHWKIKSYFSNFIITVNHEMKSFFPYKKNQFLIPFGLDTEYYNPELFLKSKEIGIFKIITVANLVPVKRIEVLIKAIHKLMQPNIFLDIIGDDKTIYANELKQLVIDLELEKRVSFLGKHTDVRPFLRESDLYVISSEKEGMPMALIEAMTMKTPVLGADISGVNYILKDFPLLLFEGLNIELLSKKINSFYEKSTTERDQIGQQLRDYSISHFSISKFIEKHEKLYMKLAQ